MEPLEVEAGIQWPDLVGFLTSAQDPDDPERWTIIQKQSGADRFSLGGTVSANGHGRGLTLAPIMADVEAMTVVGADGRLRVVDRTTDPERFSLVGGGYGLFGVIATVTLRLARAQVLERVVEIRSVEGLAEAFAGADRRRLRLRRLPVLDRRGLRGVPPRWRLLVLPAGRPGTPIPDGQRTLSREDWGRLLLLAHTDRAAAYRAYTEHYAATSGQLYRSDTLQMADYDDGYHRVIDAALGAEHPATEMISELYVPRERLADFMADAAGVLRETGVPLIYGTVRLIERDTDTVLAWAREPWACVIVNLCTEHTPKGIDRSASAFRSLIDVALARGGSYFPTYHRWATVEQLVAAHPRFPELVDAKRRLDPDGLFQSDWYRHYAALI